MAFKAKRPIVIKDVVAPLTENEKEIVAKAIEN